MRMAGTQVGRAAVRLFALVLATGLATVAATASAQGTPEVAAARPLDELFLLKLMLDADPDLVRAGARVLEREPADAFALDVAAELLEARTAHPATTEREHDADAWLMRALGASGNGGYRATIERARAADDSSKASRWGKDALAALEGKPGTPYVPGTVALPTLRAQVAAQWATHGGDGSAFAAIRKGQSLAGLLATAGPPDAFAESSRWQFVMPLRGVGALYFGHGMASLDRTPGGWAVTEVWRDVPGEVAPYTGAYPVEAALVLTSNPAVLRGLAARLLAEGASEPALLERIGARLQLASLPMAGQEVDAIRDFCRLLGRSGDARHVPALEHVADAFGEGETRRIARSALSHLR
jgi:hypothetical protein